MAEKKNIDQSEEKEKKWIANPPELDGVPDLSQLIYLDMPNVLRNVEHRYCKMNRKFCYTSISSILLAINPYESLPIYGTDVINEFYDQAQKGRLSNNRPHPYGVSARSYMRMVQRKCNQSVIVCGESGAGKTETTKLLMRYLAMTAPSTASTVSSSIEEQIVAASPILEAYGNAKTVMNNNSSRFGKFTKLLYNVPHNTQNGNILGSSLETYLLEKSRVVYQSLNERNYHIFYFLHEGIGKNNKEFGTQTIDKFNYCNQGKCFDSMKDLERFTELKESLNLFRIDNDVQSILFKLTSGVMNLGNINFKKTGDGFTEIDKSSYKYLEIVSNLWQIKAKELENRLTKASITINRNTIIRNIQYDNAVSNRDSISKGIYENIFLWLANRINAELLVENEDDNKDDDDDNNYFIGILDVFGFENFYFNSLEQFCINYTNEKLQQYFNYHIIRSEQEEYLKESVFWKPLTIPDNEKYIKLVENPKYGFFTLLDSACKGPSTNPADACTAFMQQLFNKHNKNPTLSRKTKPGSGSCRGKPASKSSRSKPRTKFDGFMITHFADNVTYDVSKFLIKNMESVHSDTNKMIKKSSSMIFKQINGVDGIKKQRKKKKNKKSVTAVFYSGIKKLMKNLNQTEPYFVRCINPNKQKSSKVWNNKIVEHQLRCGGLLEALKVLKLGYPTRVPYHKLYEEYHGSVTNPLIKNMSPESFSTSLLIAFDVNENDYELGLTKIFFKPSKAAVLETIMSKAGEPLTTEQNEKITKYIVAKRCKQIVGTIKSFTTLRKIIRLKRAANNWSYSGRVASLIGGSVMKHLYMARKQIKERKRKEAAILMQTFFRSTYERTHYIKHIDKVKKSSKMVWISYNNMKQREGLSNWLNKKVEERRIENERKEKERQLAVQREKILKQKQKLKAENDKIEKEKLEKEKLEREKLEKERLEKEKLEKEKLEKERLEKEKLEKERLEKERKEKEEKLEMERKAKIEAEREEQEALRREIDAEKEKQRNSAGENKKLSIKEQTKIKQRERDEQIKKNMHDRKVQDKKARRKKRKDAKKKKLRKKYGSMAVVGFDADDFDDDDDDEEYEERKDRDYNDDIIDEDEEEEYESSDSEVESIKTLLTRFNKTASMGQLFYRHAGARRRNKPQDRVVKVTFNHSGKPMEISWGSGSRHIYFRDIMYVAWGHYTPVFDARRNALDEKKCFSVVGRGQILDLEGYNEHITELWVKGLRKLIGHSDEKSQKLAETNMKNLVEDKEKEKNKKKKEKQQVRNIMAIQQDLFIMSTHTVYRHLDEERIWQVDDAVREKFSPMVMYEKALKQDIPWRQWQHWIREKITTYLRENNMVIIQKPNVYDNFYISQPPQPPQPPTQYVPYPPQPQPPVYNPMNPAMGTNNHAVPPPVYIPSYNNYDNNYNNNMNNKVGYNVNNGNNYNNGNNVNNDNNGNTVGNGGNNTPEEEKCSLM